MFKSCPFFRNSTQSHNTHGKKRSISAKLWKTILLNYTTFMKYTRKKSLPFTPHTSLSTDIYCVYNHDFVYCIAYRRTRFPYCRKRREKTIKMAGYWDQIGTRLLVHIIQNKIGKNFLDIHMQNVQNEQDFLDILYACCPRSIAYYHTLSGYTRVIL